MTATGEAAAIVPAAFGTRERRLRTYARAVFRQGLKVRVALAGSGRRRAGFDGDIVQVPIAFNGLPDALAESNWTAAFAHVAAHRLYSPAARFQVGRLKPIQVALVSLIEDARVEALAIQAHPGLAGLWRPLHQAVPGGLANAPSLLSRLARALLDPRYEDDNPWVAKGRGLFDEARCRLHDPAISRDIGNRLGNDLGQMRIQFDARSYVVEPSYRDDNHGLWDFPLPEHPPEDQAEYETQSASVERQEQDNGIPDGPDAAPSAPDDVAANLVPDEASAPLDGGPRIVLYPEWDYVIERQRPDWVTIREALAPAGDGRALADRLEGDAGLVRRLTSLISSNAIGRPVRRRRCLEGDGLDLDACIDAVAELRRGHVPAPAIYIRTRMPHRDLAVLLLLDISQSTLDRLADGSGTVLDAIRQAAALLGDALGRLGDPVAIHAFQSNGRGQVDYLLVKEFGEAGGAVPARLAGLQGGYSTRLGAAIRHAGRHLSQHRSFRNLLLVVTDGEPSDVDSHDRRYLTEDARHAVRELAGRGIAAHAIGLESGADQALERVFGRHGYVFVHNLRHLPERLLQLYSRLRR